MPRHAPYDVGYQRRDYPTLWGWTEFLEASGRNDFALRYLRQNKADFPRPVATLAQGPVWDASECRAFLKAHRKQERARVSDEDIARIRSLRDAGVAVRDIAAVVEVAEMTVRRHMEGT